MGIRNFGGKSKRWGKGRQQSRSEFGSSKGIKGRICGICGENLGRNWVKSKNDFREN